MQISIRGMNSARQLFLIIVLFFPRYSSCMKGVSALFVFLKNLEND